MSSSAYFGSGSANPFRPDGDLSKEADGIVSAVKNGTLNEVGLSFSIRTCDPDRLKRLYPRFLPLASMRIKTATRMVPRGTSCAATRSVGPRTTEMGV